MAKPIFSPVFAKPIARVEMMHLETTCKQRSAKFHVSRQNQGSTQLFARRGNELFW